MRQSLCPDTLLLQVTKEIEDAPDEGLRAVEDLLVRFPTDPRLHFLQGSLLAARQQFAASRASFQRALDLDPSYAIARFQLGLLELTSADAASAAATWRPLAKLSETDPLRVFADGLQALANDRFAEAVTTLQHGIDLNETNEPLNENIRLFIQKIIGHDRQPAGTAPEVNAVHWLLQQYGQKPTKH